MAGRLHDRLADRLPGRQIFHDVSSIALGADFEQRIEDALKQSSVMLVLIDQDWLEVEEGKRRPRVWDPDDFVRLEIAWAVRHGLLIIPVLVDDAGMPDKNELPDDIADLASRNAAEIRNSRFADDFTRLLRAIEPRIDDFGADEAHRRAPAVWSAVGGALAALVLLFGLLIAHREITDEPMAARLGLWGSVLLVPLFALAGGLIGWRLRRRRGEGVDGRH